MVNAQHDVRDSPPMYSSEISNNALLPGQELTCNILGTLETWRTFWQAFDMYLASCHRDYLHSTAMCIYMWSYWIKMTPLPVKIIIDSKPCDTIIKKSWIKYVSNRIFIIHAILIYPIVRRSWFISLCSKSFGTIHSFDCKHVFGQTPTVVGMTVCSFSNRTVSPSPLGKIHRWFLIEDISRHSQAYTYSWLISELLSLR